MKNAQRVERDRQICEHYQTGNSLTSCSRKFGLSIQRIQQILKAAEVWRPHVRSHRTNFLGVTLTQLDKEALRAEAERQERSMSAVTSDWVHDKLEQLKQQNGGSDVSTSAECERPMDT